MKMIMVIAPPARREELRVLIESHGVHAFTEVGEVTGEGATGKHLGTHAWPGTSLLLFTVIDADRTGELLEALRTFRGKLYPEEGLKAFVLPVEEAL